MDALIESGERLDMSIQVECYPAEFMAQARQGFGKTRANALLKSLPDFAGAIWNIAETRIRVTLSYA